MPTPSPIPNEEERNSAPSKSDQVDPVALPPLENRPFVMASRAVGSGGQDKTNRMLLIAIGLCILLVGFFAFISTKGSGKKKPPRYRPENQTWAECSHLPVRDRLFLLTK